jgi:hypothetical protein
MNRQIMALLAEAGVSRRVNWRDVVVSLAPSPSGDAYTDDDEWDGGFNVVVLDGGAPQYYCKFRPAGDPGLERETRVRVSLRGGMTAPLSIPDVRTATSDTISVQVSPFIRGSHYGRIAPTQSLDEYLQTVGSVLTGAGRLSDVAQQTGIAGSVGGASTNLADSAAEHVAYLAPLLELSSESMQALSEALTTVSDVPSRPQHGDLWWRNLLVDGDRLWVIDLEDYGTVQLPLYDAFTLLSSTIALRVPGASCDMECLFGDSPESQACRGLLTAQADLEGLSRRQLDGVLAYYVTHRASVVHRRSGQPYADPHIANVRFVADSLAEGRSLFPIDN